MPRIAHAHKCKKESLRKHVPPEYTPRTESQGTHSELTERRPAAAAGELQLEAHHPAEAQRDPPNLVIDVVISNPASGDGIS